MTDAHPANLVAFDHPEGQRLTAIAEELLTQGGVVAGMVGNHAPANSLGVALQAVLRIVETRELTYAEVLAGLASAVGWTLSNESDLDVRVQVLNVFTRTAWESAVRGDAAETAFHTEPQGTA